MKKIFTILFLVSSFVWGQTLSNLVISEYVEGSSYNKYIEIGNATGTDISLDGWSIKIYHNGSTSPSTILLSNVTLADGDVYVIANSSATEWSGTPDQETGSLDFNGNDAVALNDGTNNIDVLGIIGDGSDYAKDITLRRKAGVQPTTTYDANNFDTFPKNTVDGLGDIAPLPVELTTFSASIVNNKVELNWETATEVNNYGFNVERKYQESSIKNQEWQEIGFVEGSGNSNSPKYYSFTDNEVGSGKYFYRLKQVDIDGSFEYSDVIEVDLSSPIKYELSQNFPNPFNPTTSIQFSLPEASKVKLIVYNVIGEQVAELVNKDMETGFHNVQFDASKLNSGIYIYKLEANNFTQVRKMMLVK